IDGSLAETIFMSLLGGFAFSLIAALVISVFVVWPVNAVRNPTALFRDAMLSDDPAVAATNIVAVRALSGVMMLAFVVPTLMMLSDGDDPSWWVGAELIPVLVWRVYLLWERQRVDHGRRAKYGMAPPVPNPADPPPDHRSTLRTRRTVDQLSAPAGPLTHSRRSAWSTSASVTPPPGTRPLGVRRGGSAPIPRCSRAGCRRQSFTGLAGRAERLSAPVSRAVPRPASRTLFDAAKAACGRSGGDLDAARLVERQRGLRASRIRPLQRGPHPGHREERAGYSAASAFSIIARLCAGVSESTANRSIARLYGSRSSGLSRYSAPLRCSMYTTSGNSASANRSSANAPSAA